MARQDARICEVCGNEIASRVTRCPFCESPVRAASSRASSRAPRAGSGGGRKVGVSAGKGAGTTSPGARVTSINLKAGMPTVASALQQLEHALATQRLLGTRVAIVVHGYGSTGKGGAIGKAVRQQLRALQAKGSLRTVVAGEDYSEFEDSARTLLAKYPQLQQTFRTDRCNPGITLIEL